jgi:hypothetical protein
MPCFLPCNANINQNVEIPSRLRDFDARNRNAFDLLCKPRTLTAMMKLLAGCEKTPRHAVFDVPTAAPERG